MSATVTDTAGGELVYRALDPGHLKIRDDQGGGGAVLEGRMMPYGEWTEVDSAIEGHFMERFAPGSLAKTLGERGRQIRVLFEHGMDFTLGKQPIATFDEFRDEEDGAYFEASLLRSVPPLILEGLRYGVYGSSVRFRPLPGKLDRVRSPGRSEHNPQGLPEHTVREAFVREFSVVTFPQYDGATAGVRSLTDEVAAQQLMRDPARLAQIIERTTNSEPSHSGRAEEPEPEEPDDGEPPIKAPPERSRGTQPTRDYLKRQEAEPRWLL